MMSTYDAPNPRYIEAARAIDARLRPVVERICARLGITVEQVLADGFELPAPAVIHSRNFPGQALPLEAYAAASEAVAAPRPAATAAGGEDTSGERAA